MNRQTLDIPTAARPEAAAATGETAPATTALQSLAERFRTAGLFLVMFRPDGSVAYHDADGGGFFKRYVLPLLQSHDRADAEVRRQLATLTTLSAGSALVTPANATAELTVLTLPGVVGVAFPYAEKRLTPGLMVIVGKGADFTSADDLPEDVARACGALELDATWLAQQAETLPGYGPEAIKRQGRAFLTAAREQVRMAGLEQELDSLSGQLANTYEELSLIYQISSGMKINRRAPDFFRQACLDVREVINVRGMGVALRADVANGPEPVLYGTLALPQADVARLAEELMIVLNERKSALLINDLAAGKQVRWLGQSARQLLAVPLQRQDQVLGCLFAIDKEDGEFDSVDSKLLNSIANESAIYLENAMLFEDVHGLMMGLLHSLTSAVDAKDAYTCGHSERVALLSRHLAAQAGMSDRNVEQIYMAGLLHDVGKIGVPEAVLQKTGKLTNEEFEQIKKHPEIGARILQDVKQLQEIIPGVLHHHERYDGKGYPAGLAGQGIPVMGRIICLADCFDAMTSSRTYRKALPLEVALTEIRRCAGTQFDPVLAETFLRTGPDGFRELLRDHQAKAKYLRDLQESLRSM